ncbi:nucleobase:cation symporter-2 family protein [Amycolatopsis sp. NPDC051071]|uniref:nucleobase:cation symporter-2 family protein n=1 Tax=Amycolatopsis sp. NPDC051071 TaxID=3154637 RepID=UPI00342C3FEB
MVKRTQAEAAGRPEDERLGVGKSFTYGIQHVLTMYGGIIAPPLILGSAAGVSPAEVGMLVASCLFIGGLATILQSYGVPFFGSRLPLVQGTSFAGVATMTAIVADGGLPAVFGAVIASAVLGLLITPVFSRLVKYFPPVVTGTVITVIGLSLMPVAAQWAMGNNAKAPDFGSVSNIGLAALTLAIVLLLSKVAVPAISRLSILLSIVVGTVLAAVLGKTDFSKVADGPIFAVPAPFAFGVPTFDVAAIVSMFIVVLVTLTETTADILAVGEIVGTRVSKRRIGDGLRADMASSAIAPIFSAFTQSAFAQNVGLVAITGVRSRFVVTAGGVILLILGMLPILGRVVAAIPYPVLGGAGLVLFGTVAASGIKTLSTVNYNGNMNLVIVAASVGLGMIPIAAPDFYHHFPAWVGTIFHSGISAAALMAVLLNLLFNHLKPGKAGTDPSVFATATRVIDYSDLKAFSQLENGDKIVDGKIVDAEGNPVPVRDADGRPVHYRIGTEPEAH